VRRRAKGQGRKAGAAVEVQLGLGGRAATLVAVVVRHESGPDGARLAVEFQGAAPEAMQLVRDYVGTLLSTHVT
jgi:hypothetical protein